MDYRGVVEVELDEDTKSPDLFFTVRGFLRVIEKRFLPSEVRWRLQFLEFANSCPPDHLIAIIGNTLSYVDPADLPDE